MSLVAFSSRKNMKIFLSILTCFLICLYCFGQAPIEIERLNKALKTATTDSAKFTLHFRLYREFVESNNDSALYHVEQEIAIAARNNMKLSQADALETKGYVLQRFGKYAESLRTLNQALEIANNPKNEARNWFPDSLGTPHEVRLRIQGYIQLDLGHVKGSTNNLDEQIVHYKTAIRLAEKIGNYELLGLVSMNLGAVYLWTFNELDSALQMQQKALISFQRAGHKKWLNVVLGALGDIYLRKKDYKLAVNYLHKAIQAAQEVNNLENIFWCSNSLTEHYIEVQNRDSSSYYVKKMGDLVRFQSAALPENAAELYYILLSKSFKLNNQPDSAYKYLNLAFFLKDSSYQAQVKNLTDVQNLSFEEKIRAEKLEKEKAALQNRVRQYILLGGLGMVLLVALFLYRNNKQKQKVNLALEQTLTTLKSTQSQLIQSEKLASLGELTAGIAHEIQNPLNFVNNFAEVSAEMIGEMEEELEKGDTQEAKAIAADLKQNLQRINHHGQRASSIVKGMLEHSRTSTGVKEPTDLNVLADEYLRLAYHGLKAKDNSFNATLETHFDHELPLVSVIPQDIGRVLLNLINNAFYTVNEKAKLGIEGYEPTVKVSSCIVGDWVEIRVKDNGNGISESIREKIFQPFFTTKPTGQGTGLGLSLAYDIVVKGHGGTLEVESTAGQGTEFLIQLPNKGKGK